MKLELMKSNLLDQCETFAEVFDTWHDNIVQNNQIGRSTYLPELGYDNVTAQFSAIKRTYDGRRVLAEYSFYISSIRQLTLPELPVSIQSEVLMSRVSSSDQEIIIATPKMLEDYSGDDDSDTEDFDVTVTNRYNLDLSADITDFVAHDIYESFSDEQYERSAVFNVDEFLHPGPISTLKSANMLADAEGSVIPDSSIDFDLSFGEFYEDHKDAWQFAGESQKAHYRKILAISAFIKTGTLSNGLLDSFIAR